MGRHLLGPVTQLVYRAASTEELLRRFSLDRDADAFGVLVERFRTLVLRRCGTVLGREDLASDAAQETFIALAKHAPTLVDAPRLVRWLEKVARNKAKDIYRRERRLRLLTLSVAPPALAVDDKSGDRLQRAELKEQVERALSQLPRVQRQAVELCCLDGLTQREVAAILDTPPTTIAWRVQEGLERLKRILSRRGVTPVVLAMLPGLFAQQAEAASQLTQAWTEAALSAAATPPRTGFAWLGVLAAKKSALVALFAAVMIVLAVVHRRNSPPEATPASRPSQAVDAIVHRPAPAEERETLQQRNLRLLRSEVEPRIVEALRTLVQGQGDVSIVSRAAHDHHVVCSAEVRHFADQPERTYVSRYRIVYDMLADGFWLSVDPYGRGDFRNVDPKRPIILWRNPQTGKETVRRIEALEKIEQVFRLISPDSRAIAECTHAWEAQPKTGAGPFIPGPVDTWAGNNHQLFVKVSNWLWAARLDSPELQWRCLGPCRGEHLAVNEESLFIVHEEQLLTRPADGEVLHWQPLCRIKDAVVQLAATREHVYCVRVNSEFRVHAAADTNYAWPVIGAVDSTALFGAADVVYCVDKTRTLLGRPTTMVETPWMPVEQNLPAAILLAHGRHAVTLAGGRLWEVVRESGGVSTLRSRALDAPNTSWSFAGTVIQVEAYRPESLLRFDGQSP